MKLLPLAVVLLVVPLFKKSQAQAMIELVEGLVVIVIGLVLVKEVAVPKQTWLLTKDGVGKG